MDNDGNGSTLQSLHARKKLIELLKLSGIHHRKLLRALEDIPRHLFVEPELLNVAYNNVPLPIGEGQTISQPYIVAQMTQLLLDKWPTGKDPDENIRILEVGSGSGYQTAILAALFKHVYSIERVKSLLDTARQHLSLLNLSHVQWRHGDGFKGWPEEAPFDLIIVTAAPSELPQALCNQLARHGRMVIPVGEPYNQNLIIVDREGDTFKTTQIEPVRFVPLIEGTLK